MVAKKYKLKVYKLNGDIPLKIKEKLISLAHEKKFTTLSSFLAAEVREYLLLENPSADKLLPKDILMYYDTLPDVSTNNFTFYIPLSLKDKFSALAKGNIRPLKQQAKHFIYYVYHKYNQ